MERSIVGVSVGRVSRARVGGTSRWRARGSARVVAPLGVVAQSVRVPVRHTGGRGFEPRQPRSHRPRVPPAAREPKARSSDGQSGRLISARSDVQLVPGLLRGYGRVPAAHPRMTRPWWNPGDTPPSESGGVMDIAPGSPRAPHGPRAHHRAVGPARAIHAGVAQLAERRLARADAAGSTPASRSPERPPVTPPLDGPFRTPVRLRRTSRP